MDDFTLLSYYSNPSGKGSAIMSGQKDVMEKYKEECDKIEDDIKLNWYKHKNKFVIAHVKIPSSSVNTIKYDIVFMFEVDLRKPSQYKTFAQIPMKVFCNSPSFVYTYAYAYNNKGLIIPWLKDKYDKKTLTSAPKTRNVYQVISLDKIFYMATHYLLNGHCRYDIVKQTATDVVNLNTISNTIDTFEMLMYQYDLEKSKIKPKTETKKKKSGSSSNKNSSNTSKGMVTKVPKTRKIKSVSKVKKI